MSGERLVAEGAALLVREAAYLDERRFDDWVALYAEDCVYWVPTWANDEAPISDPQAEISHIYYANRAGLEDRIVRIRSRWSPASSPLPRTTHLLGTVLPIEPPTPQRLRLRLPWVTHAFYPATQESHAFFGSSEVDLAAGPAGWRIARKKIVLQNDYIPTMLDVYCL